MEENIYDNVLEEDEDKYKTIIFIINFLVFNFGISIIVTFFGKIMMYNIYFDPIRIILPHFISDEFALSTILDII